MEDKKKIGMSGLNWFLSIVGILLFASFIILPPVFRALLADEEDSEIAASPSPTLDVTPSPSPSLSPTPNLNEDVVRICIKQGEQVDNQYIFQSKDDKILMFATTTTTHYQEGEEFTENCSLESSLYQDIPGFYHSCSIEGNDMIVESRLQIEEDIPENIPIFYDLKQGAKSLEQELISLGFVCEENKEE